MVFFTCQLWTHCRVFQSLQHEIQKDLFSMNEWKQSSLFASESKVNTQFYMVKTFNAHAK